MYLGFISWVGWQCSFIVSQISLNLLPWKWSMSILLCTHTYWYCDLSCIVHVHLYTNSTEWSITHYATAYKQVRQLRWWCLERSVRNTDHQWRWSFTAFLRCLPRSLIKLLVTRYFSAVQKPLKVDTASVKCLIRLTRCIIYVISLGSPMTCHFLGCFTSLVSPPFCPISMMLLILWYSTNSTMSVKDCTEQMWQLLLT